ncbi:hypothetical protein ABTY59_15350 [Streptomyces sp. NPDC096079]|uniref:hypothetical protein n=1 Tax=unclassified Streptomyces TaxID=2593676 RepID=UPI00332DEBFF
MPQAKSALRTTAKVLAVPALIATVVAAFRKFPGGGTPTVTEAARFPGGGTPTATEAARFPGGGTPGADGEERRFPSGGTPA